MKKRSDRNLAEGEATGHAHRVTELDAEVYGEESERELIAPSGATVTHEEHQTFTLPPADYEISIQREIDPETEDVRKVVD